MPLEPMHITLSDAEKVEVLKRFYNRYKEELETVETSIAEILTAHAQSEFLVQYLGEQPEVLELKGRDEELQKLQKRRAHIGMLIDRLEQVIPKRGGEAEPTTFTRF